VKTFSCFHFTFEPTATKQDFVNQQNSLNAIEQFCRDEYAGLYRYAWALLGNKDDALETVQESFLRFYRMWREGAIRQHDRALLFRLPTTAPTGTPQALLSPTLVAVSPTPTMALPSLAALQAAEVEALYALHQAQADLGEQLEVVREDDRRIVVRGLVQTATRKEELSQLLRRIPLVNPNILAIDEAVQQAQRAAVPPANDTVMAASENAVTSAATTPTVNAFQQRLIEEFGGRKGMSESDREAVNTRVTQFYNSVEADASAAMVAAWALRRLQERFTATTDFDTASRQRWDEMLSHHTTRLRQHVRSLQTRLRPQLLKLSNETPTVASAAEATRDAKMHTVFRAVEQIRQLTDQLIAGPSAAALPPTARALLTEFARLDAALSDLEKNKN
jgi:hypothetical protein